MSAARWRDPTGDIWTALLTEDPTAGLHFSVQGNGRRPTDDEVLEAQLAHNHGRWVPTAEGEKLREVTALRDELGYTVNPNVRQFTSPGVYRVFAQLVEEVRAQRN